MSRMEIDFLGLSSKIADYGLVGEKDSGGWECEYPETGEGDVSLSLSTSSQLDRGRTEFPDFGEKRTLKFPFGKMTSASNSCGLAGKSDWESEQPSLSLVGRPVLSSSGFMHNHNVDQTIFRNPFELPNQATSATMFYHLSSHDMSAQQAGRRMYMAGNPSSDDTQKCTSGHVPTVAMARRATLARFLEKRSHRLIQTRKLHLMGRTLI